MYIRNILWHHRCSVSRLGQYSGRASRENMCIASGMIAIVCILKIYIYVLQVNWAVVLFCLRNVANVAENASRFLPQRLFLQFLLAQGAIERLGENKRARAGAPPHELIIIRSIFARATGYEAAPFSRFPVMRFYILVVFVNNFDCNTVT